MTIKDIKLFSIVLVLLTLSGCATLPQPIAFSNRLQENTKIGILLAESPKAEPRYTGAIGLLDRGIIAAANASLTKYLETLKFDDDLYLLPGKMKEALEKKGYLAEIVNERIPLESANKLKTHVKGVTQNEYAVYKDKYAFKHLLVLRVVRIGTTRPYYGFIPTAPPVSSVSMWGELVDVGSKSVLWYRTVAAEKVIPDPWDEKDSGYPNLTNSIYSALNNAMEKIMVDLQYPEASATLE